MTGPLAPGDPGALTPGALGALASGDHDALARFLTAESRGHERLLLEGAVMHEDGRPMDAGHLEHDVYPLDGSVSPRVLDSALTDRLTAFTWDGTPGRGIFEFALTRSPAYAYQPTLS